jgi:hypothetical protein
MAAPIPAPVAADNTGLPDSQWISAVRDSLEDYPRTKIETWTADGVNGVIGANASPVSVAQAPINDGSLVVRDNTAAVNYTVITSGTPTSGPPPQVLANLNTGELQFVTAPPNTDVIQVSYQPCKWRDQKILDGLYAGLRAMFPVVGKVYTDTSINIQVNVWDYTLPIWAQDPRSRVNNIDVRDPGITVEPYRRLAGGFTRVDLRTIHIPRAMFYSPTANLRVTGWGPYLTLGDLEPQLFQLPVWYALSVLLPKKESFRIRQDTMVPLTQEGGQQPGLLTQTGDYYLKRFEAELDRLSKVPGPGAVAGIRTTYDNRHW